MSIEDTTPSTVPLGSDLAEHSTDSMGVGAQFSPPPPTGDPLEPGSSQLSQLSKWWWVGGSVLVLLAMVAAASALVPADWVTKERYVLAPGSATNTADAITVRGAESYPPVGEIAFTTVRIKRDISIWEWLSARRDDVSELVPPSDIDGNRTTDETRAVSQFQMDQSQDIATLVALNYLGYEIVPEIEGAFVTLLVDGSPAASALRLGDLITSVDGTDIRSSEDLSVEIQSKSPGDEIEITLMRSAAQAGGSGADADAVEQVLRVVLAEHAEIDGAGFLGVQIETPVRADVPFDVSIDVGAVRGPSAGLAFSLATLDVLTEGELTGGLLVATTGTIDRFGNVGAVGGVPQKTEAAVNEGIELFLVPPSEFVEAMATASGRLDVRCVQTFDDAVLALAEFGGNGVEVALDHGASVPEPSPDLVDPNDNWLSCAEAEASVLAEETSG